MKAIIERFQAEYTHTNALRLGRPHALIDDNRTKITEHMDKNPGMSAHHAAQELGHKCEMACLMLKKRRVFPLSNFRVAQTEVERLHSTLQLLRLIFGKIWP